MPIDIYFYSSLAQGAVVMVIMLMILVLRRSVSSRWVFVGFELILSTILLRRVDDVLAYFGIDFLGPATPVILSWIATTVLFVAFLKVWIRRNEIAHIVSRLKVSQRYIDAIRQDDEKLQRFR